MNSSSRLQEHQSKHFARKRRGKSFVVAGLALFSLCIGVFLLGRVTQLPFINIKIVEVKGADQSIIDSIRSAALESMEGDYLGLFSRANILIFPKSQIAASVRASSARVEDVNISRNKFDSIVITVKEKEPSAIVCDTFPDFDKGRLRFGDGEECALADESGFIYKMASTSPSVFNRYYIPDLADEASTTDKLLRLFATSTSEFRDLQNFYKGMKNAGIEVQAILFKDRGEYEAYVGNPAKSASLAPSNATTSQSGTAVIYFNNSRPLTEELTNLLLFWERALGEAKSKKTVPTFEYIDVRYGPNVFFRESK